MFQLRAHQSSECQILFELRQATCRGSAATTAETIAATTIGAAVTSRTAIHTSAARTETAKTVAGRVVANRFDRRDSAWAVRVRLDRDFLRRQSVALLCTTAHIRVSIDDADAIRLGSSADNRANNHCADERTN